MADHYLLGLEYNIYISPNHLSPPIPLISSRSAKRKKTTADMQGARTRIRTYTLYTSEAAPQILAWLESKETRYLGFVQML